MFLSIPKSHNMNACYNLGITLEVIYINLFSNSKPEKRFINHKSRNLEKSPTAGYYVTGLMGSCIIKKKDRKLQSCVLKHCKENKGTILNIYFFTNYRMSKI